MLLTSLKGDLEEKKSNTESDNKWIFNKTL